MSSKLRLTISPRVRARLIIPILAALLALAATLPGAENASAGSIQFQIIGDDYQRALTLERLLLLGMLGLVVLTWFYLKWRPPHDEDRDQQQPPDQD
jgi:hypothetical protein